MAISNASNQIVKVNLIPGKIPSVLHLSQYDTGAGRPITFSVYDGSQAFTIPSGVSIAFEGTKPDGNGFSFTCSKSGNNALLTNYTNQMTALSGKIMCQLVFTNTSGGRVGSLPVLMVVTPAGINGDTVISDSDIEAIIAAQNQYAVLNAKLDTAISAATQDSEVQDIRVKADGTIATTAGNAVREQITDLKSAINLELKVFEDGTNQLLNGGMLTGSINADGTIDTSIKYRAYTPLLQKYDRDVLLHIKSPATGFFLCLYDSSGNFVSRTSYGVDTTVSANTNFRVCVFASSNTPQDVLYRSITFTSLIKILSDDLADLSDWEDYKQYALSNGVVLFNGEYINASVNASGVIDTSLTFRVTTKDIIHNTNKIYIRVKTDWQAWLTTYQQNGTFIERTNKQSGIFSIPADSYFRITIGKTNEVPGRADIKTFILNVFVANPENDISVRKWVAIGDSLTEVNQTATKRYCDYVAESLNLELVNMGVGGTGYKNGYDNSRAFYQRVQSAPTDADVYTFFGSGNDGASTLNNFPIGEPADTGTNSICGCVNTALDNLYAINPSAIVGIITPTPWAIWPPYGVENTGATLPAQDPSWMQKYSDALVAVCKRRGIPCLDLYHCSAMRPWNNTFRTLFYSHDENNGVHPDENGHKYFIAPHIQEFVKMLIQYP